MKNSLLVVNDEIQFASCDEFSVSGKEITFLKNGDYVIEYVSCHHIQFDFHVLDSVFVKLFIVSRDNDIISFNHFILDEKSDLVLFLFYDNKGVNCHDVIDLNGEFSRFYMGFSSITRYHEEYHIIVNHNKKNVCSDIRNKCVCLDGSEIVLQIDSNLDKGNTDCVIDQSSRILTLGDVDAKVIPNMFIDEDSVSARHGSIIGSFSLDEVFYMMSRGICYDEAILLLIKGFLFSNMVVSYDKREFIMNSILNIRR